MLQNDVLYCLVNMLSILLYFMSDQYARVLLCTISIFQIDSK